MQWRHDRLAIYATALFTIAIGLLVDAGLLMQRLPGASIPTFGPDALQHGTGLSLCGSGLIALLRGRLHISQGCAATVGLLGLLTQIEYAFRVDLGIDQL